MEVKVQAEAAKQSVEKENRANQIKRKNKRSATIDLAILQLSL